MPKDPKKYYYVTFGLTRGSWGLEQFEEDMRRHHMEDNPGKLAALRLTEYYELMERLHAAGLALPGGQQPDEYTAPMQPVAVTSRKHGAGSAQTMTKPEAVTTDVVVSSQEFASTNAGNSLDLWENDWGPEEEGNG